jgi:hypothetical protein
MLFSKDDGGIRKWSKDATYFVGAFPSDLNSCSSGIPNGVGIRIDFTLSDSQFFLVTDQTNATFELEEVMLHVPCAELTDELALKVQNRLKKEDALIQFRRRQCIPFIIPKDTSVFLSDSKDNILNSKIVVILYPFFYSTLPRNGATMSNCLGFCNTDSLSRDICNQSL